MSRPIRYILITSRGIGEPVKNNLTYNAAVRISALFDERWEKSRSSRPQQPEVVIAENLYPASYGPLPKLDGVSFDESMTLHAREMERIFRENDDARYDNRFILFSYSAGAAGAGDWVNTQTRESSLSKIFRMVQISDPSMPRGVDTLTKGGQACFGIRGSRPIAIAERVLWVFNHKDVINSCPEYSPLRPIAKATPGIALGSRISWLNVLQKLGMMESAAKIANAFRWNAPAEEREEIIKEYQQAGEDAYGYLAGGEHTSYGSRYAPGKSGITYVEDMIGEVVGLMYVNATY